MKTYYFDAYEDPDYYVGDERPEGEAEAPSATVDEGPDGLATTAVYVAPTGVTLTLVASTPLEGRRLASVLLTSWPHFSGDSEGGAEG